MFKTVNEHIKRKEDPPFLKDKEYVFLGENITSFNSSTRRDCARAKHKIRARVSPKNGKWTYWCPSEKIFWQ